MQKLPEAIPNENLTASVVPPTTASWHLIQEFALTLNGYEVIGQKECGTLANRVKKEFSVSTTSLQRLSLTELRSCLFFEQRRFHHFGEEPVGDDRVFVNALLDAIHQKL